MWPVARRRRAVSPPYYPNYDNLDLYRTYPTYDALAPSYGHNYPISYNALGLEAFTAPTTPLQAVEVATRAHVTAQKEYEKAKEKHEEAKKKMEDCEQKMKQAEDLLRAAKCSAVYAS
jgi:hypothetical protein